MTHPPKVFANDIGISVFSPDPRMRIPPDTATRADRNGAHPQRPATSIKPAMTHQIHFNLIMLSMPVNHTVGMWADKNDRHFAGLSSFAYWQELAKNVEQAKFDAIFFADVAA